ncbi:MAG: hypothetical protein HDR15_11075 [Lachnospiraceae bacterium]|nr:hypothetical protein [Lachnospiraceae bacterium]
MQTGKMGHKVGVKLLSDRQLENVLPTYQNLLNKIEVCREIAENKSNDMDKWNYQYNYMYDNVFSILGQRGAGKTSVAFTLQRKLQDKAKKDKNGDVILPLIIPEVIPENCSILGWLLAIVKDKIEQLDEYIKNKGKKNCLQEDWKPCKYAQGKTLTLRDRLDQIYKAFYSKNYNPSNENSYYRSVENSVLQAHGFYEVSKKIAELWDAWVDAIKFANENEEEQEEGAKRKTTPMIYFIFDDVDLAPEKIGELLSVIVKYLSHPNIIVLTTADEEMFLEVVENRLDRSIGRLPREWRNYLIQNQNQGQNYIFWDAIENEEQKGKEKKDIVSTTARMYLGKVLPASTRYYLRMFHTAKEKAEFYMEEESKLGEAIVAQIDEIYGCIKAENESMNFMRKGDEQIYYYLKFMGNTSRQIGNAFIALKELLLNIQNIIDEENKKGENSNKERVLERIYQHIRYFLCVAINTNHQMSETIGSVEDFVNEAFLAEYNHWRLYCDYAYLNEFLYHRMKGKTKAEQIEIGQQAYALLAFIESLLLLLENCLPKGLTGRTKIYATEYLAPFIQDVALNGRSVFRDDLDGKEFIWQYESLLDRLGEIINYESSEQKFNLEYFYHFRDMADTLSAQEFFYMNRNNHKWFMEIVRMVTRVYGNVYAFGKKDMDGCYPKFQGNFYTNYQEQIRKDFHENMEGIFRKVRMREEIIPYRDYFDTVIASAKEILEEERTPNSTNVKGYPEAFLGFMDNLKTKYTDKGAPSAAKPKVNVKYVRLTSIIEDIIKGLQGEKSVWEQDTERWNRFWKMCPPVLYDTIMHKDENGINSDAAKTREALSRCISQIENLDNLGKKAILFNWHVLIERLKGLTQIETPYKSQLKAVLEEIKEARKKGGGNNLVSNGLIVDRELYCDVVELCNIFSQMGKMEEGTGDKNYEHLWEVGEELMGCMDIAIEINNNEELRRAVLGGMYIIWAKVLQGLYVYQIASERYSRGTNTSSKALEKNKKGDTYYYQMFKYIEICVEGKAKESDDTQINWYLDDEILKRDVRSAYTTERHQYVSRLLDEVEYGAV